MKWLITLCCLYFFITVDAQTGLLKGTVRDATNDEPLVGATIQINDNEIFTTDANGSFVISIKTGSIKIKTSYIGYTSEVDKLEVFFSDDVRQIDVTIRLQPSVSILGQVVITGSQYEKILVDEPVTIEVIRNDFISKNNITSLSEAVERVPGVQMVDDQVNIRSSGYSFGAGSRVGIIVDDQPLLGGLSSDIRWNFIPFENAKQIEILKGASSVLYGSAAMNGVINVVTAWPTSEPETMISFYAGEYDTPKSAYRQWWTEETRPLTRGFLFSHRARTEKFDLVLGANYHHRIEHLQDLEENRTRINWKTRYRFTDKVSFGINGNMMSHSSPTFLIWQDADTNSLKHIGPYRNNKFITYSIDPHLTIFDKWDNEHSVKARFFMVEFIRNNGNPNAPGLMRNLDYHFKKEINDNFRLTAGVSNQYYFAETRTPTVDTSQARQTYSADISAVFTQLDMDFMQDRLNLVVGLRGEYITAGDSAFQKTIPVSRVSLVYKPSDKHRWRFNSGQGYRIPSLEERFIETDLFQTGIPFLPAIGLLPNPNILPEVGWSLEFGYKHLLKNDYINGYLDVALFNMDYWNMVEVVFGYFGQGALDPSQIGFKSVNISRGRIAGLEVSTYVNGQIGPIPYRFWGGYTYTYPGDLDSIKNKDMNYFVNLFQAMGNVENNEALQETILKYRSLHTARLDLEFPFKVVALGATANFNGYMWQIDDILLSQGTIGELIYLLNNNQELIPGYRDFRETSKGGDWIYDARLSVDLGKHIRLGFIVNNLTNKEYALRPGRMNSPRTYNVKCQLNF
jgi:outer membrane receptor protein involved in Fe transport